MPASPFFRRACLTAALALLPAAGAAAAQTPPDYEPVPGMPGKDVVWIPSPEHTVDAMLDLARVTPQDFVIDLGSGDGRNVIAAALRGARALGVEFNPDLVALSKRAAMEAGVGDRATFVQGDMFEADISHATVLALFILPAHLARLTPKFLSLRPGARIVTNTYEIGGGWEPDERLYAQPCRTWCVLSLYIVPARVEGTWALPDGASLTLEQDFQKLTGRYDLDGLSVPVENARLRGNEIRFTINRTEYTGRVDGDAMRGLARGRTQETWSAGRTQP